MRPVLPWFRPPALLVAWLGCRAARRLGAEGASRSDARWMLAVALSPLLIWLAAQLAALGREVTP